MRDFTLKKYRQLLRALKARGYEFRTFESYCGGQKDGRFVVLRHDVDLKAENSLRTAILEKEEGIRAVYYFRIVPQSCKPDIIKAIAAAGHEIGYHYEDMTVCSGDTVKAFMHFKQWLDYFRAFYPVKTVCMHGSPRSPYDAKDLWKCHDYHELGIIGEPYFDIDFSKVFYLTDTGRRWDGFKMSVRDKIPHYQDEWSKAGLVYHSSDDIIRAVRNNTLPPQIMITTHPQRWTDSILAWVEELCLQNAKNTVKFFIAGRKKS